MPEHHCLGRVRDFLDQLDKERPAPGGFRRSGVPSVLVRAHRGGADRVGTSEDGDSDPVRHASERVHDGGSSQRAPEAKSQLKPQPRTIPDQVPAPDRSPGSSGSTNPDAVRSTLVTAR